MIEYPSIIGPRKAPREMCYAFEKYDGSNIRVKWTSKKGFDTFGSRTQLIDASHPHLGQVVEVFNRDYKEKLEQYLSKNFRDEREVICYGEFFGPNSFAGIHVAEDPKSFVLFDVLVGHKNRVFVKPNDFVKYLGSIVKIPRLIYNGILNEEFIEQVRSGFYEGIVEGVVCKGISTNGAYRGKVWMCKIKTRTYLDKIRQRGLNMVSYGEGD